MAIFNFKVFMLATFAVAIAGQDLPSLYDYFGEGGFNTGLTADKDGFKLNGKPLRIISGAIHYFRVHPSRWRDSLRKLRATGANTVETYIPWNLHEPHRGVYDFGDGDNDLSEFLNLKKYIQLAQEEDLLVLFRPGPYICSEFEFGGFPSWLLQDPNIQVRSKYQPYLDRIKIFYDKLLPIVYDLQFVRGGPIIGIQIENEYGYFNPNDKEYLEFLVNIYKTTGFERTLLYTSDGSWPGDRGSLPELLMTLNFQSDPVGNIDTLLQNQPDKPVMVMEFWTGWYDNWFEDHHKWDPREFYEVLDTIMGRYNGSVNFYMFQGGTNFGFTAGGSVSEDGHNGVTTSYDYDAPLTEAGDYTEKYEMIVELTEKYGYPKLKNPARPQQKVKASYESVKPEKFLDYNSLLRQVPSNAKFILQNTTSMEKLDMNYGSGQTFGYIVHRFTTTNARNGSVLKAGPVKDFGVVVLDGAVQESSFAGEGRSRYWINRERDIPLTVETPGSHTVDVLVECMDRINTGWQDEYASQSKGLPNGTISLDGQSISNFEVFALEFRQSWLKNLTNFQPITDISKLKAPLLVQSNFNVIGEPRDTFLDLTGWHKGIAFINGFNIGRYFKVGPQQRLYVPGPLLRTGTNTVMIFEQLELGQEIQFSSTPDIGK